MATRNPPLSPGDLARIREVYAKIVEAPREQQSALVELLCGNDDQFRSEIDGLLSANRNAGSFLEGTASVVFNHLVFPDLQELNSGAILASRFHILRYIGRGGMGAVYEAWDAELQETVALKTIRPEIASHPSIIERFKQEVRQAHRVTHPNICRVNDLFSHDFSPEHRLWFLTMQLLNGETLEQRLQNDGPLPRDEALEVIRQIISGLSEAHRHGIIHRDFKSANVMLLAGGDRIRAVITDFGLACEATTGKLGGEEHAGQGTPAYAAPEQWFDGTATPATDQYSLGVVMCEILTGERPTLAKRASDSLLPARLPTNKKIDRHWESAIRRCLKVRPENRFHSLENILTSIDPAHRRKVAIRWAAFFLAAGTISITVILSIKDLNRLPIIAGQRRITPEGNVLSEGPRLSRDGKKLVYVSDQERNGNLDVYVYTLPNGASKRITTYPELNERPAISPDGNWVAFETAQRPAGVYLANVNGGAATLIASDGHEPSFSPDGRWILYWTGGDEFVVSPNGRIFLYDLNKRESLQLAHDMSDARVPLWNSDGDHILFTGCAAQPKTPYPDCKDWWVTSVKDELTEATNAPRKGPRPTGASSVLASKGLTPTQYLGGWQDDAVVFSARHNSPVVGLWEIKLNPRTAIIKGEPKQLIRGDSRDFIISSSIAGTSIAMCEWHPSIHIRRIDQPQSATPKESTVTHDPEFDLGPSISHNGRWLIFTRGSTKTRRIHVIDTWNGVESQPEFDETGINSPIIDDTGKRIAFEATGKKVPVIRVSIEGRKQTLCSDCRRPSGWMSQSSRILYGNSALSEIRVQDIQGGQPTTILSAPQKHVQDAAWSPENGYIAFTVLKEVKHGNEKRIVIQVFVARYVSAQGIPEDRWIEVTGEADYSRKPQWSGDGKTIYYLSKRDGNWCLWGQRFDPERGRLVGKAFAVRHYHDPKSTPGSVNADGLNFSVAGDEIYLNVLETTGTIYAGELAHPGLFSREY